MTHEMEVRFSKPLRGAQRMSPGEGLPVSPAPVQPPAAAPSPPPPPPPASLWDTEIGRQLARDRELIGTTLNRLTETVKALDERHRQRLAEWQQTAIELGLTIAARLLRVKILAGEMAIETVVREAVNRLKPDEPITVSLNPADLELLQKRLGDQALFPHRSSVYVVSDPTLGRGDCRAEGRDTSVVSEIAVQLGAMRQALLENLAHAQPGP